VLLRRAIPIALAFLALAGTAAAQGTLYWDELSVRARLDAEGVLHVEELQAIVFDGTWNGGERRFRLGAGQELHLDGMDRIDAATGARVPLRCCSTSSVDGYDWHDATTLRWRSREASDPPFRNRRIVYVLRYRLSGVLEPRLQGYNLDHDFAFTDRAGDIRSFALDLELDPVWSPPEGFSPRVEVEKLPPGEGHVVDLDLGYRGSGRPAGVDVWTSRVVLGTRAALVFLPLLGLLRFFWSETRNGRFAPLPVAEVDRAWLEQNVLPQPPEVVGAAWDEAVGAPEVAAVLARMVAERKLASTVSRPGAKPELELKLLVARDTLPEPERALVAKLFFAGDTTSTTKLRDHYKKTGFDPAGTIRDHVQKAAQAYLARDGEAKPSALRGGGWLFLAGAGLIALGRPGEQHVPFLAPGAFALVFPAVIALVLASVFKDRLHWGRLHSAVFLIPASLLLVVAAVILRFPEAAGRHALIHAGVTALAVSMFIGIVNAARSARGPRGTAFRKRLAAVREFFRRELKKPAPALKDEWFPYLVAFGLERDADRWFGSFAGASRSGGSSMRTSTSTSSSGGRSTPWTGGGGAFGGAGASATWAAAASGLAAGVASPSSSRSSGGGGGGGGRSGGGGGGGW
jgi:hypothetical protein